MITDNHEYRTRDKKRDNMSSQALIRRENARRRVLDMKEARALGMTVEEYMEVMNKH